jgi:hypothetical protein
MEETYANGDLPSNCLTKLVFPKNRIGGLIDTLVRIGYTDLIVSPSLEGLAKEIRRVYGYLVEYV